MQYMQGTGRPQVRARAFSVVPATSQWNWARLPLWICPCNLTVVMQGSSPSNEGNLKDFEGEDHRRIPNEGSSPSNREDHSSGHTCFPRTSPNDYVDGNSRHGTGACGVSSLMFRCYATSGISCPFSFQLACLSCPMREISHSVPWRFGF